jgi:hypothetical protein
MRTVKKHLDNRELSTIGEFYSRVYIFDVFNNENLRKKHYEISIGEWESFMMEFENFVDNLVVHLMDIICYSCKCEFRHFGSQTYPQSFSTPNFLDGFINSLGDHKYKFSVNKSVCLTESQRELLGGRLRFLLKNNYNRKTSCDRLDTLFSEDETYDLMKIILSSFKNYKWDSYYGGKKWADGVNAWFRLYNAKSLKDKIVAIDHAYDLQHNTGLLFNKVDSYHKVESRLQRYLNKKRYARNLSEIVHSSRTINQHVRHEEIFCYPKSYKTIVKLGNKMGVLV